MWMLCVACCRHRRCCCHCRSALVAVSALPGFPAPGCAVHQQGLPHLLQAEKGGKGTQRSARNTGTLCGLVKVPLAYSVAVVAEEEPHLCQLWFGVAVSVGGVSYGNMVAAACRHPCLPFPLSLMFCACVGSVMVPGCRGCYAWLLFCCTGDMTCHVTHYGLLSREFVFIWVVAHCWVSRAVCRFSHIQVLGVHESMSAASGQIWLAAHCHRAG